jgi:hypothetical protein
MKNLTWITILIITVSCGQENSQSLTDTKIKKIIADQLINKEDDNSNQTILPYFTEEEVAATPETITESSEVNKVLICDVSNENELQTLEFKTIEDDNGKRVILVGEDEKITFDGYTLSPSGNENAAVLHNEMHNLSSEGKVIKITARVVMNEEINDGELQISYKIQKPKQGVMNTDYFKLADINNCTY